MGKRHLKKNKTWMKMGLPSIKSWKFTLCYISGTSTSTSFSSQQSIDENRVDVKERQSSSKFMQRPEMTPLHFLDE